MACRLGHLCLVDYWLKAVCMPKLFQITDMFRCQDKFGNDYAAPLPWIAAAFGHCDLLRSLHARGANVGDTACDGSTPFYRACESGHLEVLRQLRDWNVDMVRSNQDGTAPVHVAAANGHLEVVKFLSERWCQLADAWYHLLGIWSFQLG